MKIYKDKQYLVFELDDGSTVKYDFATKTSIGRKGLAVKNICAQLRGLTVEDMEKYCSDPNYVRFISYVRYREAERRHHIRNIGSILDAIPYYSSIEQLFSAGLKLNRHEYFEFGINDIPKGLIKIASSNDIVLTNSLVKIYKMYPNEVNTVLSKHYQSMSRNDVANYLVSKSYDYRHYGNVFHVDTFIKEYGYSFVRLIDYFDEIKTYEACDDPMWLLRDYARMMHEIGNKFDKYPRHLRTTHDIASRNYKRLKDKFDEEAFQKRIKPEMEYRYGNYVFMYPRSTQDIKDEAVMQNNCVASYIGSVINGHCDILLMRDINEKDKALVTIEVRDNKIVQARQKYNYVVTHDQQVAIDHWNAWWARKVEAADENVAA